MDEKYSRIDITNDLRIKYQNYLRPKINTISICQSNEGVWLETLSITIIQDKGWTKETINRINLDFISEDDDIALLAIQGPKSEALLRRACPTLPEKPFTFIDNVTCFNRPVLISKTGYTGESGYEVYGAQGVIGYYDTYKFDKSYITIIKDGAGVGR